MLVRIDDEGRPSKLPGIYFQVVVLLLPELEAAPSFTSLSRHLRRKMKARAPPPPGKAATPNVSSGQNPPRGVSPVCQQNPPHMQDAPRDSAMDVTVVLPSGMERRTVVNGR